MARFDRSYMALRILAVLLAVILWIYVSNEQNPVNEQILSVPLQKKGQSEDISVKGIPGSVSVRVQATRGRLAKLLPSDFQAFIDLTGLSEGEQSRSVEIVNRSEVQVVSTVPNRVDVFAEYIIEKDVAVIAIAKGQPARGYAAIAPVVDPAFVALRGTRTKVNSVKDLSVTVNIQGTNSSMELSLPVEGVPEGVVVSPGKVKVVVPIAPLPAKNIPVKVKTAGKPLDGFEVSGFTINPAEVQVVAPAEIIQSVQRLDTREINIEGIDSDVTTQVYIQSTPGIIQVKPEMVEITIHIRKLEASPVNVPQ